jgi:hypothetical protein
MDSRQWRVGSGLMGSRSAVPSRHHHSAQWLPGNLREMLQGASTIGKGTAFRKREGSKTMKTKTNLKAGMGLNYTKIEFAY